MKQFQFSTWSYLRPLILFMAAQSAHGCFQVTPFLSGTSVIAEEKAP